MLLSAGLWIVDGKGDDSLLNHLEQLPNLNISVK